MKKLSCKDLAGPCDVHFEAETFDELTEKCKAHVMEQITAGDEDYLAAVEKMKNTPPEDQQKMFAESKQKWDEVEAV